MGQHALLDLMTARDNVRVIFCTNIPESTKTEYTLKEKWATLMGAHVSCQAYNFLYDDYHFFFHLSSLV